MKSEIARQILEKVKLDYDTIASEFSQTRKAPWAEFETFKSKIPPHATIADIGCGNGRLIESLPKDITYTGIDISKNLLSEAKKLHPTKAFTEGSLLDIPLPPNSVDVTFCIATLPHIPSRELREKAIHELIRITKPNGIIIISVWNLWQRKYLPSILKAILSKIFRGPHDWNDLFIGWNNKLERYYHAFTKSELHRLVAKELTIEKIFTSHHNIIVICKKG